MLEITKDGARIGQYFGTIPQARAWIGRLGLSGYNVSDQRATEGAAALNLADLGPLERARLAGKAVTECSGDTGRILELLAARKVSALLLDTVEGPRTLRYTVALAPDTAVGKLRRMEPDFALALGESSARIAASTQPGRIYIEVPREAAQLVTLAAVALPVPPGLTLPLGIDPQGQVLITNLGELPHMLIAGATGSGKSVFLHSLLCALSQNAPEQVRLCLIDVKRVELTRWASLPHLVAPVAVELGDALLQLSAVLSEIQRRYSVLQGAGASNISDYGGEMPRLVVVVDELADLILGEQQAAQTATMLLARIAQIGRAAGVHIIAATQRPDSRVLSGLLKANIPARIAFAVPSHVDSRVILDQSGAEKLLGKGDLLFSQPGLPLQRAQGCFVDADSIAEAVERWQGHAAQYWDVPVPQMPVSYFDTEDYKQRQAHIRELTERAGASRFKARELRGKYDRDWKLHLLWGLSIPLILLLLAFAMGGGSWGLLAVVIGGLSLWSQKIARAQQ